MCSFRGERGTVEKPVRLREYGMFKNRCFKKLCMSDKLFSENPEIYDKFFDEKEYEGEAAFMTDAFEERNDTDGRNCLVLGCGTGRHSEHLADEGFEVTGIDKYEKMVETARSRAEGTFRQGTLPDLDLEADAYDLVLLPFNIVNYVEYDELEPTLELVADAIKPGGVLLFDSVPMPPETQSLHIQTVVEDDADHARIVQMQPGGQHQVRWESIVLSEDVESGFFVDNVDITVYDDDEIVTGLEDLGFTVEQRDSYGDATRPEEAITVFVAVKE